MHGHLCMKCLLSKNLIEPPEYISVEVCQGCWKVLDRSVWRDMPHEDVAASILEKETKTHGQVEELRWEIPDFEPIKGEHRVSGKAHFKVAGEYLSLDFNLGIRIRYQKCPTCSRQSGDYYEAIIQLRRDGLTLKNADAELAEETQMVLKIVEEHASTDENAFITKYSAVKGGMDFYLGSSALARTIANKFRNRFAATVNESPSLVGMKDGNDLYRYSILVRLPFFREGDVVSLKEKVYLVDANDGKVLVLKSARNGELDRVSVNESGLRLVARQHEIMEAVVVTHDRSSIQILDPSSMVAVTIARPSYMKKLGVTVPVVRYDEMLHVV